MRIQQRLAESVIILDLNGRLTRNDGFREIKACVRSLLNMEEVSYIDSIGIGELVSVFITTRNHQGKLKLMHLTDRMRELFDVAKLIHVFEVFDDEAEILRSF